MKWFSVWRQVALCLMIVCLLPGCRGVTADSEDVLGTGFKDPPHSAGIRCFWWWLNSNVTRESITRDLEEMKAKGFNGALIFDADGSSQRGNHRAPAGPVFGSPEWTALFVHACREARRLDLELSLNIQSGWNLGGPKVTAEEANQHLVWSRTNVEGPQSGGIILPAPVSGDTFYRDIAVLAVPLQQGKRQAIKNLDLKTSTRELGSSAPDCRFLLETTAAEPGEIFVQRDQIINLTGKMTGDGILEHTMPAGKWEILSIGHTATQGHVSTHSEGWGGGFSII